MRRLFFAILLLFFGHAFFPAVAGQKHSFETAMPGETLIRGRGSVAQESLLFKDGAYSLRFSWEGQAELLITDKQAIEASMQDGRNGIMLWICNEKPLNGPLHIALKNVEGREICGFDFGMAFTGWRAAWIKYEDMHAGNGYYGDIPAAERGKDGVCLSFRPWAGDVSGSFCLDRLSFSLEQINRQVVPDMQIPDNNHFLTREVLWHWGRLWEWERYPQPEAVAPSVDDMASLAQMEKNMDGYFMSEPPFGDGYNPIKYRKTLEKNFEALHLARNADGFVSGAPIVHEDELAAGDSKIQDAFDVMYRYAVDYRLTGDGRSLERFFLVGDHILWQGIAFGSGIGTNHHYGYKIRGWANSLWLLRKEITAAGKMEEYRRALDYWSGLSECRLPFEKDRDEIIDSWNTLLVPKMTAAMLLPSDGERLAYMKCITDWMGASMKFNDGTIGGFKADGTAFHHGGHYPAYAVGAFSTLGTYCRLIAHTSFVPSAAGRTCLKTALMALRTYCNERDWGIGVSGRHPFEGYDKPYGNIPEKVQEAFGSLAVLGDLSGSGKSADPDLGGAYLALGGKDREVCRILASDGIKASASPEGFFVFNYGAFGIHRRDTWMVTLKGYNSDVWCSEIYTNDNRFGRYQSYGSVQVTSPGKPASAAASGFSEAGWDWNRMSGTTTIHLPFEMLESPNKGTLMERNPSRFPGVSSLEGMNGVLAFTYVEKDRRNFCPGATATKSVFCFDNRIVFLGTGISNKSPYPTETTLFQQKLSDKGEAVIADDGLLSAFPIGMTFSSEEGHVVEDLRENCFIVPKGQRLKVLKATQTSPLNTKKKTGTGDFVTALLDHGTSPSGASYEYLLLVAPSGKERKLYSRKAPYEVLRADDSAHVVKDVPTGITGYVSYEGYSGRGTLVKEIPAETIVMERIRRDGITVISVCAPDLGLTEKTYTTRQPSQPLVREVVLVGEYVLAAEYSDTVFGTCASVDASNGATTVKATCRAGRPVELLLKKK